MQKKKRVLNKSTILESNLITPHLRRLVVDISKFEHISKNDLGGYIKLSVQGPNGEEVLRSISVASIEV